MKGLFKLVLTLPSVRKVEHVIYSKFRVPKTGCCLVLNWKLSAMARRRDSTLTSEGGGRPVFRSTPGSQGSSGRSRTHRQAEEAH